MRELYKEIQAKKMMISLKFVETANKGYNIIKLIIHSIKEEACVRTLAFIVVYIQRVL